MFNFSAFIRFCRWFARMLVLWVLAAVGIGYFFPQALVPLKPYSDWLFALTMFGIGMVLTPKDFEPMVKKPQTVGLGTLAQFAIMPALAFAVAKIVKLSPELTLGLVLAGAVPDAMAAGVISYLAEADVALSVALTTATTLISPVVTPGFTYFFINAIIPVKFFPIFLSIIKMVIIPLILGLAVKHYFKKQVENIVPLFPALSSLFIAFICGLVVALNKDALSKLTIGIFIAVAMLNLLGMLFGYLAGLIFKFDTKQCRTLSIGVGMQNAGMGAVIALKHFSAEAAIPNVLFATWCILTASVFARIWRNK